MEDFYCIKINNKVAMLAKLFREAGIIDKEVYTLYESYMIEDNKNKNFDDFLSCKLCIWFLTSNNNSPFKWDCSCPIYNLYGQCKHVIQYTLRNNIILLYEELNLESLG